MTSRVFVARHAERAAFARGVPSGWDAEWGKTNSRCWDDPLTAAGIQQAEELARQLPDDLRAVISSPFLRCLQTAMVVAAAKKLKTVFVDYGLSEWMKQEWFGHNDRAPSDVMLPLRELQAIADTANGGAIVLALQQPAMYNEWTEWEQDEDTRPQALVQYILTHAQELDRTLLVSHGGVVHRTAQVLTGQHMSLGDFGFATWAEFCVPHLSAAGEAGGAGGVADGVVGGVDGVVGGVDRVGGEAAIGGAAGATGAAAGAAGVAGALPDKVLDKAESEEDLEQQLAPPAGQTGSYAHPSTLSMYLERRPWTSCPRRSTLPSLPHHSVKRPIDEPAMISEPLSAMAQETIFGNSG